MDESDFITRTITAVFCGPHDQKLAAGLEPVSNPDTMTMHHGCLSRQGKSLYPSVFSFNQVPRLHFFFDGSCFQGELSERFHLVMGSRDLLLKVFKVLYLDL